MRVEVRGATQTIDPEDVDDLIGLAAEMRERDRDRLTVDELREVAEEVGIEARYLDQALAALTSRRREEAALQAARAARGAARRRRLGLVALGVLGALAVVGVGLGGLLWSRHGDLVPLDAEVRRARAQWRNVVERQAAVEERLRDVPPGRERQAELAGAENRVRIERRRYDETAAAYNAEAGSVLGAWAASLGGLPTEAPLSDAVGGRP